MGVLESISDLFGTESAEKYRCDDCGAVCKVEAGSDDPTCGQCGSTAVEFVNRV
ncbi:MULTISPECIES: hypothetical protein [Haloarcula]|uniref:hypothetical protein n=1 Tax=Haloarcula TaxID=2237 RepID=UPI0023EC9DB4|nr:hypothetical protein [Halomicroarcula sp. XH51]